MVIFYNHFETVSMKNENEWSQSWSFMLSRVNYLFQQAVF